MAETTPTDARPPAAEAAEPHEAPLDETAVIARDLIRIDTTNHGEGRSNGEREAAEYVEARLRAMGLEPAVYESAPRRTSVPSRGMGEAWSLGQAGRCAFGRAR